MKNNIALYYMPSVALDIDFNDLIDPCAAYQGPNKEGPKRILIVPV
jgi:hypothetical protein